MFGPKKLRIGAAGHRLNQLAPEVRPNVERAIDAALTGVDAAVREAAGKSARITLISGLAEGADRMAAQGALKRGWRLEAPLPFSIERYEKDFSGPDSVAEFQGLLKRAVKVTPRPGNDKDGDAGYASVAKAVSQDIDALICVWNGDPPKGPGGTAEVAACGLDSGAPVLWITEEGAATRLILPAEKAARKGAVAKRLREALSARFERVDRPAELRHAEA